MLTILTSPSGLATLFRQSYKQPRSRGNRDRVSTRKWNMSPRQRNVIVGAVVLLGLGIIAWMVLLFAGRLAEYFSAPGLVVTITADRADGVTSGSEVKYLGIAVGRVIDVRRGSDNKSVIIDSEVERQPPLPANVTAVIRMEGAFGTAASVFLELQGPPSGTLAPGTHLRAQYEGPSLLPREITQVAEDLTRQRLIEHLDQTVISIREQSERAGKVLESVQQIVADPTMRQNLREALTNIRVATESATRVGNDLEKFTGNLKHVSEQTTATMSDVRVAAARLGSVLDHFESVAAKVDQGKGTAGLLVNDPKLYQGLVDSTRTLNATVADLQRVILQWEQEGVTLKLGK